MSEPREHLQALEALGPAGQWACERIISLTLENLRLKEQVEAAQASNRKLEEALEARQRQAHRQAAPFRRADAQPDAQPGRPGRKGGHAGTFRQAAAHLDEALYVPLESCPHCGGTVGQKRPLVQYIEEIPEVRPRVTQLTTEEGWCAHCQQEVYSMHRLQTGRAGGAAAAQLGPRALALACDLNKAKGLSMRQTTAILAQHPDLCVPALVPLLKPPIINVRSSALSALDKFGSAAKPAWRELSECHKDEPPVVRNYATNLLRRIDAQAAAGLGVK